MCIRLISPASSADSIVVLWEGTFDNSALSLPVEPDSPEQALMVSSSPTDAWRFYRDFFYDPQMRGADWTSERDNITIWRDRISQLA